MVHNQSQPTNDQPAPESPSTTPTTPATQEQQLSPLAQHRITTSAEQRTTAQFKQGTGSDPSDTREDKNAPLTTTEKREPANNISKELSELSQAGRVLRRLLYKTELELIIYKAAEAVDAVENKVDPSAVNAGSVTSRSLDTVCKKLIVEVNKQSKNLIALAKESTFFSRLVKRDPALKFSWPDENLDAVLEDFSDELGSIEYSFENIPKIQQNLDEIRKAISFWKPCLDAIDRLKNTISKSF